MREEKRSLLRRKGRYPPEGLGPSGCALDLLGVSVKMLKVWVMRGERHEFYNDFKYHTRQ